MFKSVLKLNNNLVYSQTVCFIISDYTYMTISRP